MNSVWETIKKTSKLFSLPSTAPSNTVQTAESPKELLKNIPLTRNGSGVYTKSDANVNYLLIKEQEVVWENYVFESNGKKIFIKILKGEEPPTKKLFDRQ